MSKLSLNNIGSRYGSVDALNANFSAIEEALQNTVSRDGSLPNDMEAALDMNSNPILNASTIYASSIIIGGQTIEPGNAVSAATMQVFQFTASAGQTSYSVSPLEPTSSALTMVVNGLDIPVSAISTSTTFVNFPPLSAGDEVVIRIFTRDVNAAADASEVTFTQEGTGASTRTVQTKLRDVVSVKDFGATGDGTTNDTAAMQAAHNTGNVIYYPAGTYKFTTLTNITNGGIVGDGQTKTILSSTDTSSNDLISFTGASVGGPANGLTFRDFQVLGAVSGPNPAKAAGGALALKPSSGENSYASFYNVTTNYVPTGIRMVAASLWSVIGCNFLAYNVAGIDVANSNDKDSGDSTIQGCVFNNPYTTGAAVLQRSSGGLRVIGNKMLGGGEGYKLSYESTPGVSGTGATSILFITANSIENMNGSGISFTRTSGTQTFKNIIIQGNEFAGQSFHISSSSTVFLEQMVVNGNVFQMPGSGLTYGVAVTGVNDVIISSNVFRGNGGTPLAVGLTSCVNAKIGPNVYANISNPITLTTPGVNNIIHNDSQSGVALTSTSGWTTYGTALFQSPITTVTFPQAYLETPAVTDISLEPGAGSGEVGVVVVAVTKTQLQFVAISAVNAIAAVVNWKVWGVL